MLRVSEDGSRRRDAHAAGYRDLGRALLNLQAAADQVFDAISQRTAEEREKLAAISRRIKAAKAKIKTLSQSEELLTIVSPSQHPSSRSKQEDFKPLFRYKYDNNDAGLPIANIALNGAFNREYGLEGTLELFQFFSEENYDYPSKAVGLKATDELAQTKDDTYLERPLEKASFPTFWNSSESALDPDSDDLPPPPPSLLPKHLNKIKKSDYIRLESNVNPSHSSKLPDTEN